jgi:hypothetical protein
MSKGYNKLEIKSLYGIYDRTTDKMIVHVPYNAVFFLMVEYMIKESLLPNRAFKKRPLPQSCVEQS